MGIPKIVGTEWLVEATGCGENLLRNQNLVQSLFTSIISDLGLKTIGKQVWHKFPGEGGVTGLVALTESHLACHTYPEYGIATFNLYCCKDRPEWDWEAGLRKFLSADEVTVTKIQRGAGVMRKGLSSRAYPSDGFGYELLAGGEA
jgi:S-adenosylmethionine decarboxylase